jgi:GNAT superfamily N-acetyltransferase
MQIRQAATEVELDQARALMRAFVAWSRALYADSPELVDRYFDKTAFEAELAGLPGRFAPPRGRLLLAMEEGRALGCVALRDLGDGVGEVKRMYVADDARGRGVGWALAERILAEAREAGHARLRLDTSVRQAEAIALYERLGFRRIPAYYPVPAGMEDWLMFYELAL